MKKDLLLLHGAISSKDQFSKLTPLLDDNFNCYSINFSGHGGTELPKESFTIELFANNVLNWMEEQGKATIDIFGYSMGGYVALYLAHYYPEKIGNIFTLSTKFNWTEESANKEVKLLNPEKIEAKVPKFAAILQKRHQDWKAVLQKTADMMIALGEHPVISDKNFEQIAHNIVVGTGDLDPTATSSEAYEIQQKLPNGQLLILPNTNHPFEQIDLELLALHISKFFNR